jgi:hypothetical protein
MNWMAAALLLLILAFASPAWGTPQLGGIGGVFKKKPKPQPEQQQQQQPSGDQKKDEKKDDKKPLFADDSATAKQKKDTTAMGFSGLNPDGTVENAVLNSSPTAEDGAKAAAMAGTRVAPGDLHQFLADGKLKAKGGQ